jgi:hypothetical protein
MYRQGRKSVHVQYRHTILINLTTRYILATTKRLPLNVFDLKVVEGWDAELGDTEG